MDKISYCSNVHAGANLDETRLNLAKFAVSVKQQFSPNQPMGVGLWLSNEAASQLVANSADRDAFGEFLASEGLEASTFNGFPFGNFHQRIVKHAVYHPTWFDVDRLQYTRKLVALIQQFNRVGPWSISTLPIAWGNPSPKAAEIEAAAMHLRDLAGELAIIRAETGSEIYICIEPEPGCYLQTAPDIVHFFESALLEPTAVREGNVSEADIRQHIRVCHDVCHSVVMCESQETALATYHRAGVLVGKAQISSAVWVDFDALDPHDRVEAVSQLSAFAEDRYLHQTTVEVRGQAPRFFEDLPIALEALDSPQSAVGIWRIHFHVPVYLESFGHLRASREAIQEFLDVCRQYSAVSHFEVETYAWNVLPPELQKENLADGIAAELQWFQQEAALRLQGSNA